MKCLVWVKYYSVILIMVVAVAKQQRQQLQQSVTDEDGIPVDIQANLTTLVHVHAIWRHGDRTPIVLLPNDPDNDEKSWKISLGELTTDGIKQAFRLGRLLRQRYNGFLSDIFKTSEIYVRSTDFNRTLMTAEAVLQGLYPQKYREGNLTIWHPIPVHTIDSSTDRQLLLHGKCPAADEELRYIYESQAVKDIEEQNGGLLRYIGEHMGSNGSYRLPNIWYLYDPLEVITHHADEHRFPKWINQTQWREILRMYDLWSKFEYSTDLLKRLRGGELLREILTRLSELQNQNLPWQQKMYAYSAHDETLAMLLTVLGVEVHTFPAYATVVLLETHWINGEFVYQLFYKNVTDSSQFYRLPIGFCDNAPPCTLKKLKSGTKKFISKDWKTECGLTGWKGISYMQLLGLIASVLLTTSVLMIVACQLLKMEIMKRKMYAGRTLIASWDSELGPVEERTLLTEQ